MHSAVNFALSNLAQVLSEIKYDCPAWFGLLHPHPLLDSKGILAALGRGGVTRYQV